MSFTVMTLGVAPQNGRVSISKITTGTAYAVPHVAGTWVKDLPSFPHPGPPWHRRCEFPQWPSTAARSTTGAAHVS